jgi:hypothetical protein
MDRIIKIKNWRKEAYNKPYEGENQNLRTCVIADSLITGRISSICPNTFPGKTLMTAESRENIWLRVTKTFVVRAHSISNLMLISFLIVFSCHEWSKLIKGSRQNSEEVVYIFYYNINMLASQLESTHLSSLKSFWIIASIYIFNIMWAMREWTLYSILCFFKKSFIKLQVCLVLVVTIRVSIKHECKAT